MTPTAKALDLLGPLREALDQLRFTLHSHKDFSPTRGKLTVTIACTDYVQAAVLMPFAVALRQRAPGVRLAIRHWDPASMELQLSRGEIDLAITTPDPSHVHLRTRHLFTETYVLIGRRDHPSLRPGLAAEEFVKLEHVIVSPSGGAFTTPIDEALAALGHRRQVVMSAASFLFVPEIVSSSDLVALVPRRQLRSQADRLVLVDIPWLSEQFDISLIWHERSHGHAGHRWIRDLVVEVAADEGKGVRMPELARAGRATKADRRSG